jgi:hypothetical protein
MAPARRETVMNRRPVSPSKPPEINFPRQRRRRPSRKKRKPRRAMMRMRISTKVVFGIRVSFRAILLLKELLSQPK